LAFYFHIPSVLFRSHVGKSKADKMGGLCGRYGEKQNVYRVALSKPEKKNTRKVWA